MPKKTSFPDEVIQEAFERLGSKAAVARELGCSRSTISERLSAGTPILSGRKNTLPVERRIVPPKGKISRYILTSAQNNTQIHAPTWKALRVLADHYCAEILVSRFTYNKSAYSTSKNTKPGTSRNRDDCTEMWYAPEIKSYVCDRRVQLAPGLVFCGEMNILPTAIDPLSGFGSYTGRKSGIFPHTKIAMRSVASAKHEPTKFNWTTGTITQRNYLQRTAGLKAEWHHCYGAVLVEVDSSGDWFVRQLQVDDRGELYDLDLKVTNRGRIVKNVRVEAISWGDAHVTRMEKAVAETLWGEGGMIDTLRPKVQFMHDLVDIRACDHHSRNNPHARFSRYIEGNDNAVADIIDTVDFVKHADRSWCDMVVVNSNHDDWIQRWLREADYRTDPPNAVFFLEAQLEVYRHIESGEKFDVVGWAMRKCGCSNGIRFLELDESYVICKSRNDGIECGHHGHNGINGARGSARAFSRTGRRTNTGHTHSAEIIDGNWVAGVTAALDQGYNKGLSSWSQSSIVTHPNGKRQMVTLWNGKWRASSKSGC